ncbi:unnamed protein product [Ilex paraguariensis]|uniref:Uncharacterized protein n=1 Tax=Ilex paraguariensis TaxID=185542 RepID=A0ABC8T503_9AQUA
MSQRRKRSRKLESPKRLMNQRGKEKEWQNVIRKGNSKASLKENQQATQGNSKSNESREGGEDVSNKFNALRGNYVEAEASIEVVHCEGNPSYVKGAGNNENEVLISSVLVDVRGHDLGMEAEDLLFEEDADVSTDKRKESAKGDFITHTQGEGDKEGLHEGNPAYGVRPKAKEGMMGMDFLKALKVEIRRAGTKDHLD